MTTKRKPVKYDISPNSSPKFAESNQKQEPVIANFNSPSLPSRVETVAVAKPTVNEQPPLPKRPSGTTNTLSHSKQSTNSSVLSSNSELNTLSRPLLTSQSASSLDIPDTIIATTASNTFKKRALFFNTPKRLFAGDSVRNTNLAQLETNHIIDEFVSATGLTKNGGLIKDVRKHVRHATRTLDDDASVDSGKSTRDSEAANRIKQVYNDLDSLRRKNELLERILKEKNIQIDQIADLPLSPLPKDTARQDEKGDTRKNPIIDKWREIEDYTIKILNLLGIQENLESGNGQLATEENVKDQISSESKESTPPSKDFKIDNVDLPQAKPLSVLNKKEKADKKDPKDSNLEEALRETIPPLGESVAKKTLSRDDQSKLNKKADSLISAIKKSKKNDDSTLSAPSLPPKVLAEKRIESSVASFSETLNSMGSSDPDINPLQVIIPVEEHVGSPEKVAVKSVMDSFEKDLLSIMDDFGF